MQGRYYLSRREWDKETNSDQMLRCTNIPGNILCDICISCIEVLYNEHGLAPDINTYFMVLRQLTKKKDNKSREVLIRETANRLLISGHVNGGAQYSEEGYPVIRLTLENAVINAVLTAYRTINEGDAVYNARQCLQICKHFMGRSYTNKIYKTTQDIIREHYPWESLAYAHGICAHCSATDVQESRRGFVCLVCNEITQIPQ